MSATTQPTTTRSTRNLSNAALTDAAVASFDHAPSERFREIMQSLVRHLHAFAAEVGLTEQEWGTGIDFLTRAGQKCDDKRQELILLSDVLGLSMLVVGINHPVSAPSTEHTVFGPFFVEGSPASVNGDDLAKGAPGQPCLVQGRVLSKTGEPIGGARIEIWQADDDGLYDVQYPDLDRARCRGHLSCEPDGRFWFWTVKAEAYPIPTDGPVGELMAAAGRSCMRPAHVHFMITAPGYERLTTHVFDGQDPCLDSDAVFGVKSSLVGAFERHEPGQAPDGRMMDVAYWTMTYDMILEPVQSRPTVSAGTSSG